MILAQLNRRLPKRYALVRYLTLIKTGLDGQVIIGVDHVSRSQRLYHVGPQLWRFKQQQRLGRNISPIFTYYFQKKRFSSDKREGSKTQNLSICVCQVNCSKRLGYLFTHKHFLKFGFYRQVHKSSSLFLLTK